MRSRFIVWLVLLLGGLVGVTRAQPDAGTFRFEHITVNEGLSHSDAMAVVQDKNGFIWVGTNKGIDRYDGHELKPYALPINDQTGMAGNRVRALHVDRNGQLWVGVERTGLFWYDAHRDRFVAVEAYPGSDRFGPLIAQLSRSTVSAVTTDGLGRLWVSTDRCGVLMLRAEGGVLRQVQRVSLTNQPTGEPTVSRLAIDRSGRLWIGTLGHGLWYFDTQSIGSSSIGSPSMDTRQTPTGRATGQAHPVPFAGEDNIRGLFVDRRGDLWVGADTWLYWVGAPHPGRAPTPVRLKRAFNGIQSLFLDSSYRLWIGTRDALWLMPGQPATDRERRLREPPLREAEALSFLPSDADPHSINSVRVHDILEDRFHNLWLATSAGGLNQLRLREKPFGLLRQPTGKDVTAASNYINAIWKDRLTGQVWLGTRNGLTAYNPTATLPRVRSVDVSALCQDQTGTMWVGTRYGGLYTFNNRTGQPLTRLPDVPGGPGWSGASVESIVDDGAGTIWVATFNAGLHRFSRAGQHLGSYGRERGRLPSRQFTTLLYDARQQVLWASTRDAGVLKLRPTTDSLVLLRQFRHETGNPRSLRTNYAWPLLLDRQHTLWIGTIGGGLHRLVGPAGQERVDRCSDWVPELDVESLLADETGNLWMGGGGLYQINPRTRQYWHYDVTDGVQSNAFKVGAAHRADDGTMFFGGTNGVTFFQPRAIRANPHPPVVQITSLRVLNQAVGVGDTLNGRVLVAAPFDTPQALRLRASENDFSIEFVGLNYANPRKHQYAYQLEGYNSDWVRPAPGQRTASFANLPAGDYSFRVKASNGDGVWSAQPATLCFTVLPPWYRTWWAYALYAGLMAGGLVFYRRVELTQQELKNTLALEKFKADKEKEVTDLKLRFFTNVSHELRTPLTLILGPLEELVSTEGPAAGLREKLALMYGQTRKLFDLVNQLLEFRKVESGYVSLRVSRADVVPFLAEIFLLFKLKADECHVAYTMDLPTSPVPLFFDRSKLEIILTNLLSNAFKYTPEGGRIRLHVDVMGSPDQSAVFAGNVPVANYLSITIQDWGVGMHPDELANIFNPYYQASHTDTLRIVGTGIGLSLVKQLVDRHAGFIEVQSAEGKGTTFTLRLPFGQAHLSPVDIREPETAMAATTGDTVVAGGVAAAGVGTGGVVTPATLRLLLVEDNADVRQYLKQLFEPTYDVHVAADGLAGWEMVQAFPPDLIISDIMMPRSDGLELCRQVKLHPKTAHIPVLLLTARAAAIHELEGLETGADDYVIKPFNPRVLHAKVTAMLQNRQKLRTYYQRQLLLEPADVVIPDEDRQFLERAMALVEAHLTDPDFGVPRLVQEAGMSQSVFYRRLKNITGQTVVEFIRDVRMKRAAQLLAGTSMRVSDVAYQVGIEDVKYFRQSFQKIYTLTPSEYARQHRRTDREDSVPTADEGSDLA